MVSSTTIFNTSAEAVADTNKTNPTNATDKRKILIKLAAVALSAPASRCGNVSALLSRKYNPNRSKTVWRGRPFDFAQGRLSPANSVDRRRSRPLAGRKLPPRRAVQGFLLIQSEQGDRTNSEDRLFIRENILFETGHIEFVLTLVKRKYSPEQRSIPHPLSHSFNNHSLIRPLRTNHTSRISIQLPCLTRLSTSAEVNCTIEPQCP